MSAPWIAIALGVGAPLASFVFGFVCGWLRGVSGPRVIAPKEPER